MLSAQEILDSLTEEETKRAKASIAFREDIETWNAELISSVIEPSCIGPIWQKDAFGQWLLPEHTLGWEIAGWCSEYLLNPQDEGPWDFTDEQLRFILWWYAVDASGEFIYTSGTLQRLKGWGKDPLLAVICLVEFVGPCRFSHWDEDGNPVGRQQKAAWIQVSATTMDQTSNTSSMFPLLMSDTFRADFGIRGSEASEVIRAYNGRNRIQMVTSNPSAIEGKRTTFSLANETHLWLDNNNGKAMYRAMARNVAKMNSRYLCITNAYMPDENSVAQDLRELWDDICIGNQEDPGMLYDSLEANPRAPIRGPLVAHVLERVKGDAWWLKPKAILADIIVLARIAPASARRFWLNQITADDDALYGPELWEPLKRTDAVLRKGDKITLGFDGGKTDDSTALIACRVQDMQFFVIDIWESDGQGWEIDFEKVSGVVDFCFANYEVLGMFADVEGWAPWITKWSEEWGKKLAIKASDKSPIGLDMRGSQSRLTSAHERLMESIFNMKITHDGDPRLTKHVLNARRRENRYGVSFSKESRESPKKVDAYAALMLAHEAAVEYRINGKNQKRHGNRGFFM